MSEAVYSIGRFWWQDTLFLELFVRTLKLKIPYYLDMGYGIRACAILLGYWKQ